MKKNNKVSIRLLTFFLASIMLVFSCPLTVFAAVNDVPWDEYIGYEISENISDEEQQEEKNDIDVDIDPDADFEDNIVLVTFKKEYSDPEVEVTKDSFPSLNIVSVENYIISDPDENFTRDIAITLAEHDKNAVIEACREISKREDVLDVYPSYIASVDFCQIPNDPEYSNHSAPFSLIHAPAAWNITTGSSSVKVAVIDTKVDQHVDFGSNLMTGYDAYNQNNITDDVINDHGTMVASVIGAKGNNGKYSTGVCWNISIVPIQYSTDKGEIAIYLMKRVFNYLKSNNISIANFSAGINQEKMDPETIEMYNSDFKKLIEDWGGIFVCSAGNEKKNTDNEPHYPSCIDSEHVISVAAYNSGGTGLADFSNRGVNSVDIAAPGENIYVFRNTVGATTDYSGTSFAAPFVTGAAALLKSKYPDATSIEIINALKLGCQHFSWTENDVKYGCLKIDNSLNALKEIIDNRKTVNNGTYVLGAAENTFQVVDIAGSSVSNGAAAQIYESNGSDSQKFEVIYHEVDSLNNYYSIKNIKSGKYLEAAGGGTSAGTAVCQNAWSGADSQKWFIKTSSGGSYKIINKKSGLALDFGTSRPENGRKLTIQASSNSSKQNFKFISSGKKVEISDGLYKISGKNSGAYGFCVNNGNIELANPADSFMITNKDGYCYITRYFGCGNSAVCSSGGYTNVSAAPENQNDSNQKWIIRNGGDGSVYIVPYLSNKVVDLKSGSMSSGTDIILNTATGGDSQRFNLRAVDKSKGLCSTDFGEYYYAMSNEEGTYGIDVISGSYYDINESNSINHHVAFVKGMYGLFKIKDVKTGRLLNMSSDGAVSFEAANDKTSQLWNIIKVSGVYYFQNVYTERFLKYIECEDGSVNITSCTDKLDADYKDIVFKKYANIQSGTNYIIVPKSEPGKAVSFSDRAVGTGTALTLNNIDFDDEKQIFKLQEYKSSGCYTVKNVFSIMYMDFDSIVREIRLNDYTSKAFSVIQDEDGYYELIYNGGSLSYINGKFYYSKINIENNDTQKFMLIPVSDEIEKGAYQILLKDDETKAISVNSSMNSGESVSLESANAKDMSQLFYTYKENGSYKLVNMYSGELLTLADDFSTVVQKQRTPESMSQKWQIINSEQSGSDYSAKLVSYRTGDYVWYHDEALSTVYYDGASDQTFILKRVDFEGLPAYGEIISVSDTGADISSVEDKAVLSSLLTNERKTLEFTKDINGFWKISDINTGNVLDLVNGELVFVTESTSDTQKWMISRTGDGSYIIINFASGKVLKNVDGNLTLSDYDEEESGRFDILLKGDLNRDGKVNALDISMFRSYVAGNLQLDDDGVYCADFNDDGKVNAVDSALLKEYVMNKPTPMAQKAPARSKNSASYNMLTNDEIAEMTDEEFLRYLFGDVDYEALEIVIFG